MASVVDYVVLASPNLDIRNLEVTFSLILTESNVVVDPNLLIFKCLEAG